MRSGRGRRGEHGHGLLSERTNPNLPHHNWKRQKRKKKAGETHGSERILKPGPCSIKASLGTIQSGRALPSLPPSGSPPSRRPPASGLSDERLCRSPALRRLLSISPSSLLSSSPLASLWLRAHPEAEAGCRLPFTANLSLAPPSCDLISAVLYEDINN